MATIKYKSTTKTITIWLSGLDTSYAYDGRTVDFILFEANTDNRIDMGRIWIPAGASTSNSATFSDLTPSTEYYINAYIDGIVGSSSKLLRLNDVWTKDQSIGEPLFNMVATKNNDGVDLQVGLYNIIPRDILIDSTMKFALYYKGNYTPIYQTDYLELGSVYESALYNLGYTLRYDTEYVLGCTIYTNNGINYDIDTINLYYPTSPTISAKRSSSDPFKAEVTISFPDEGYNSLYLVGFCATEFGQNMMTGNPELYFSYNLVDSGINFPSTIVIPLQDAGAHQLRIADTSDGGSFYDVCDIEPLYNPNIIDETSGEVGRYITWTISELAFVDGDSSYVDFYKNGIYYSTVLFDAGVGLSASCSYYAEGNESETIQLRAEIYDGKIVNVISAVNYTFPPYPSSTILASRDVNTPTTIYLTIESVTSQKAISSIEIRTKLASSNSYETIGDIINNPKTYPIDLTFFKMGTAERRFYARITNEDGEVFTSNYVTVLASGLLIAPWEWPTREYILLTEGGATRDFRHSVWNDLVAKVSKVRIAAGYDAWNNNFANYDDTCMTDTEEGRTLTAVRYNSLKNNIGYIYSTDIPDVSPGETVEGQKHFINLTTKLNEWIDSLNNG